jgi:decaprenyl-phosphate phosphoribosyltransferase
MRPRQWIKNAFVLAPLVFAREFTDPGAVANALTAFVLFCVASSAGYILNDIHDIERDRTHPTKRHSRPLAAGTVSMRPAITLLITCYGVLLLGLFWSPATMLAILAYVVLNVAYTYVLKHQPVLDLFSIAVGFVLRVYAGALALSVPCRAGWRSPRFAWRSISPPSSAARNSPTAAPKAARCCACIRSS